MGNLIDELNALLKDEAFRVEEHMVHKNNMDILGLALRDVNGPGIAPIVYPNDDFNELSLDEKAHFLIYIWEKKIGKDRFKECFEWEYVKENVLPRLVADTNYR